MKTQGNTVIIWEQKIVAYCDRIPPATKDG